MPTITTLIENTSNQPTPTLQAEHGLSLYIEHPEATILFDTGQSGDFLTNAKLLGKDLTTTDYVIISHGHYDHGNGLPRLLSANILPKTTELLVGEEFFNLKYKQLEDKSFTYIGTSLTEQDIRSKGVHLRKINEDTTYLTDHIILFHHFTQSNNYEHLNKRFIVTPQASPIKKILPKGWETANGGEKTIDTFPDELALGIVTEKGLVIIVGCSHIGIINILTDIKQRIDIPIHMVIGGTHLVVADEQRIDHTIRSMQQLGVQKIAVSHCTGEVATKKLQETFGSQFINNHTGNVITF